MKVKAECSKDGCDKPHYALGLCKPHYSKAYRAKPGNKKKSNDAAAIYRSQPENQERLRIYRAEPENQERRRSWLGEPENQERVLRSQMRKYAMTPDDYDGILADQSDGCAVCGSVIPGGRGRFHVDHDHACCPGQKSCGKCVRGLLCAHCNFMLGHAQDDPAILRAAADYIERHQMTWEESA